MLPPYEGRAAAVEARELPKFDACQLEAMGAWHYHRAEGMTNTVHKCVFLDVLGCLLLVSKDFSFWVSIVFIVPRSKV